MSDRPGEAEAVDAAANALVAAQTNGLCVDRWPRACSGCDCFRDGNAGPGSDAFAMERQQAAHVIAETYPIIAAAVLAEAEKRLRGRDSEMGFMQGESPRPADYSEGHYTGARYGYRLSADLLASLRSELGVSR